MADTETKRLICVYTVNRRRQWFTFFRNEEGKLELFEM